MDSALGGPAGPAGGQAGWGAGGGLRLSRAPSPTSVPSAAKHEFWGRFLRLTEPSGGGPSHVGSPMAPSPPYTLPAGAAWVSLLPSPLSPRPTYSVFRRTAPPEACKCPVVVSPPTELISPLNKVPLTPPKLESSQTPPGLLFPSPSPLPAAGLRSSSRPFWIFFGLADCLRALTVNWEGTSSHLAGGDQHFVNP